MYLAHRLGLILGRVAATTDDMDQVSDEQPSATVNIVQLILPDKDAVRRDKYLSRSNDVIFTAKTLNFIGQHVFDLDDKPTFTI